MRLKQKEIEKSLQFLRIFAKTFFCQMYSQSFFCDSQFLRRHTFRKIVLHRQRMIYFCNLHMFFFLLDNLHFLESTICARIIANSRAIRLNSIFINVVLIFKFLSGKTLHIYRIIYRI